MYKHLIKKTLNNSIKKSLIDKIFKFYKYN